MSEVTMSFEEDLFDLSAGVSLLYMVHHDDEMPGRMRAAMDAKNYEETIHVAALMLNQGRIDGWNEPWMNERWGRLSRLFHAEPSDA